jgi:hypothetical protein
MPELCDMHGKEPAEFGLKGPAVVLSERNNALRDLSQCSTRFDHFPSHF